MSENVSVNKPLLKKYLVELSEWNDTKRISDASLEGIFGSSWFEGTLEESTQKLFKLMLDCIVDATHIDMEELEWFIWESNYGKKPLDCIIKTPYGRKTITVNSIDSFLETI